MSQTIKPPASDNAGQDPHQTDPQRLKAEIKKDMGRRVKK